MKECIEEVAKERLSICEKCTFHSEVRKEKLNYKTVRFDVHCVNCGCTLSAKVRCLSCSCPDGLWEACVSKEGEEDV